jgi:hypothetical protein
VRVFAKRVVEVAFVVVERVMLLKMTAPVYVCEPLRRATFEESALSAIDAAGSVIAPAEIESPAVPEMRPEKRPAIAIKSPAEMVTPFEDEIPPARVEAMPPAKVEVAELPEMVVEEVPPTVKVFAVRFPAKSEVEVAAVVVERVMLLKMFAPVKVCEALRSATFEESWLSAIDEAEVRVQAPLIAKQPPVRLMPLFSKVEVPFPTMSIAPATESAEPGVEVPIPTLPFLSTMKAVDEASELP